MLDSNPTLLGVPNGTIDLRTGTLRKPSRKDYITKLTGATYDPEARCPVWGQFLKKIFKEDKELISYIQRLAGYCLTGVTREQKIWILWGEGANGKTKLVETLRELQGDYAMAADPETFMQRRNTSAASPDLARLRADRLVTSTEPNEGCRLAEAAVKRITGEDRIACRHLYSEPFEFTPQFKVLLATNHKPTWSGFCCCPRCP